jgi:hypothetical protein
LDTLSVKSISLRKKALPGHITIQAKFKELFLIVLSLEIRVDHLKNGKIMFYSNNMAGVEIINKQTCKDTVLMRLAGEELTMVPMHELSEIENETDSQL